MIRRSITSTALYHRIGKDWVRRAANKRKRLQDDPGTTITNIWSRIKSVYMALQGSKCAFCERGIEDQPIDQDVEHFRPKKTVKRWPIPKSIEQELQAGGSQIRQPATGSERGYRLLAYHPWNFVASCKTCNSVFKRSYFPIAGPRVPDARKPTTLRQRERPYLIFPLGDLDADPEDLITFHGLSPQPGRNGFDRLRALVTIDLLGLDDHRKRKGLLLDRARAIEKLYIALDSTSPEAAAVVTRLATSPDEPHANCLRSFERLWRRRPQEARALYEPIRKLLKGTS